VADSNLQSRYGNRVRGRWAAALVLLAACAGCAELRQQPEINSQRFAPTLPDRQWQSSPVETPPQTGTAVATRLPETGRTYDLVSLVDLALSRNPDTHAAWQAALAAAAFYGRSRAPYYPLITTETQAGYSRVPFQVPQKYGTVSQWQAAPQFALSYLLLDFGRRAAQAEAAREESIAANFSFNRKLQDVVFAVEKAFYALGAAQASVAAAMQNLDLAHTNLSAVSQRRDLGLATQPQVLLAQEVQAQSVYDLQNAKVLVNDAQASLAIALGIPANHPVSVQSLESLSVPESLMPQVDALIHATLAQRPDLAAQSAALRAEQARLRQAQAAWFPTLSFGANYGEADYAYQWNGPPTIPVNTPQYSALLTLQWDIFTGFDRLNTIAQQRALQRRSEAQVQSARITAIAEVWRAYYDFQAALKKYQYARALLRSAREAYDANLETYRQGLSTIVELLTAERDLANARYTLIQSKADLLTSSATVAYAAGVAVGR
jgi:outer membrane protein